MNRLLTLISLIPYICYLYLLTKQEILTEKKGKDLFRFDTLILVIIFIYFSTFKASFVNKMLFFTINLYFLINHLYDYKAPKKINKKKEYLLFIFVYTIAALLFLPYILAKKLTISYYLAFALILFIHFIVKFAKTLCK